MPIIQKIKSEIEHLKGLKLEKKILDEVISYCKHFEVSLDEFANQSFNFVLRKDKDWKKYNKKENQRDKKSN